MIGVIVTAATCVNPASYGAVPNDGKPDTAALQQAIDHAEAISGDVCLGPGEWDVDKGRGIASLIVGGGIVPEQRTQPGQGVAERHHAGVP